MPQKWDTMSDKYTKSAKGETCTVRIPGVCNHNPATVVFAHINGGGMARKRSSIHGAYACSECHAFLDGGYAQFLWSRQMRDAEHLRAMLETQERMIKNGVLVL